MTMFWFGRNWRNYVRNVVNEKVLYEARDSLLRYLPEECYKDKVFIDVGCGSGLFSAAALLLGCKEVISFDIQEESLEAVEILRNKVRGFLPQGGSWKIFKGDILDEQLVHGLKDRGDIVYSWGVLHHTGDMWKAMNNVTKLVKSSGFLIIAIYNYAPSSPVWKSIKEFYNKHRLFQPVLGLLYGTCICLGYMVKRKTINLFRERGMHVFYDAIDWIGGYPYEYACFEEVKEYIENLGFRLIKAPVKIPCGKHKKVGLLECLRAKDTGCNEFVFEKIVDSGR